MVARRTLQRGPSRLRRCSGLLLAVMLLAAVGCGGRSAHESRTADAPDSDNRAEPILLLAAASTINAVEEIAAAFERDHGTPVRLSAGPTSALASQIITGAPADVFLSASPSWVDVLQENNLAARVRPLVTSTLVVIVPRGNPANVRTPADLLRPDVRKVALAGENVPAGIYGKQALATAGVYERLIEQGRIARGHDVRVALSYVELGEAEAGIVYETDARLSQQVDAVYAFPSASHEPIVYPVVLLPRGANRPAARALFDYLASPAAEQVFEKYGFAVLADSNRRKERP